MRAAHTLFIASVHLGDVVSRSLLTLPHEERGKKHGLRRVAGNFFLQGFYFICPSIRYFNTIKPALLSPLSTSNPIAWVLLYLFQPPGY